MGNLTSMTISQSKHQVAGGVGGPWLLIAIATAIVVTVIVILWISRLEPSKPQRGAVSGGGGWRPPQLYKYDKVRAVLREIFLRFRGAAERSIGMLLTTKTSFEIAGMLNNRKAHRFAQVYSRAMYSRERPSERDKEELENILGDLESCLEEQCGRRR